MQWKVANEDVDDRNFMMIGVESELDGLRSKWKVQKCVSGRSGMKLGGPKVLKVDGPRK